MKNKKLNKSKAISLRLHNVVYDKLVKMAVKKTQTEQKLTTISEIIREIIDEKLSK